MACYLISYCQLISFQKRINSKRYCFTRTQNNILNKMAGEPAPCEEARDENNDTNSEIEIDEAFRQSRPFGKFQCVLQMAITYLFTMIAYQSIMSYFIANDPKWECRNNRTSTFCEQNYGNEISVDDDKYLQRCKLNRNEWTYSTPTSYSFITEFDLVCTKASLAALASGVFHLGGALGVPLTGLIADRYGRRLTLIICLIVNSILSFACSAVSSIYQLIVLRAFVGAASWSCCNIAFVYLGEFISPKYRSTSAILFNLGFPLSELLIDCLAFFVRKWRYLQIYATIPCLVICPLLFLLPRSPRWLVAKNREKEAEQVLKKISELNGKPLGVISIKSAVSPTVERYSYIELLRNRKFVLTTLSQGFIWLSVSMTYYMISLQSSNLGGNMYEAFALSAVSEVPSAILATFTCNRYGRKKTILSCLVLTGAFTGAITVIPKHYSSRFTIVLGLLMIAKFFINTALTGIFIWTFEIYPTVFRLQGWSICISFERIGSFTAPFLTSVLYEYSIILPYLTVMVFMLVASAGGLYLPETNKKATRENCGDFF